MLKENAEEKITKRIDQSIKFIEFFLESFLHGKGGWDALNSASRELARLHCFLEVYEAVIHPDSYNVDYKNRVNAVDSLLQQSSPPGI